MSTTGSFDGLPESLAKVRARPLFVMRLDVQPYQVLGPAPGSFRRVGVVPGGSFEGERLRGTVLPGGSDGRRYAATAPSPWM